MKALLTSTIALGFLFMLGDIQAAEARNYNENLYQYSSDPEQAYSYRGRPTCDWKRHGYYTRPGCNEYRPYVAPVCRLICRHDFLGNPYNCHPVCY